MKMSPQQKNLYSNIIFDLFDVLITVNWTGAVSNILGEDAILTPAFMQYFKTQPWKDYRRGILNYSELEILLPQHLPSHLLQKINKQIPSHIRPIQEMIDLVHAFKKRNFGVYLLTNVTPDTFFALRQQDSLLNMFDGILASFQAKALKPQPEIYQKFLEQFSLQPQECLFIDDQGANIIAAKQLGIDGIVCSDYRSVCQELKERGLL